MSDVKYPKLSAAMKAVFANNPDLAKQQSERAKAYFDADSSRRDHIGSVSRRNWRQPETRVSHYEKRGRLTRQQVFDLLFSTGWTVDMLAKKYGVSRNTVRRIRSGQRYAIWHAEWRLQHRKLVAYLEGRE